MKKAITISFIFLCFNFAFSQSFEVPKNYQFVEKEDYALYEHYIVQAVDWLINTPINQEKEKRAEVSAFLVQWAMGSPTIHVIVHHNIVNFLDYNEPDLLLVFIGGWIKNAIEADRRKNTVADSRQNIDGLVAGNLAGIEAVIQFYNKNRRALPRIREIENYNRLLNRGRLESEIAKRVREQ